MPGGRPRLPGTSDERDAYRRRRVLQNVRRFRARHYERSKIPPSPGQPEYEVAREYTVWLSHRLPFQLNFSPSYRDAFISRFLFPSLKHQEPKSGQDDIGVLLSVNLACGSLLASSFLRLADASVEKRLMSDLLLSSALHEFASWQTDPGYKAYALQTHSIVTDALTRRVSQWRASTANHKDPPADSVSLSGVIIAFAVAELILFRSWDRFWKHLQGAGAVLQLAGADHVRAASQSRRHFHGYRQLMLSFALMYPQPSFLSDPTWIGIPSSDERDPQSQAINSLVDIGYRIAARPPDDQLLALSNHLTAWRNRIAGIDPWQPAVQTAGSPSHMTNLLVAYCALQIIVHDMLAEREIIASTTRDAVMASQLSQWTRRGILCLSKFVNSHGSTVAKLNYLFCLDAAWTASIRQGSQMDINHCQSLAEHVESRGLPLLRDHRHGYTDGE